MYDASNGRTYFGNDGRVMALRDAHLANPCPEPGCTLGVHAPSVDHAEQVVPADCPAAAHTVRSWKS